MGQLWPRLGLGFRGLEVHVHVRYSYEVPDLGSYLVVCTVTMLISLAAKSNEPLCHRFNR